MGGGGGGTPGLCGETAPGPTRGSAIAITPDDARVVLVNREVGTVSVIAVAYGSGQPELSKAAEIDVGGEPWQVAIDACGTRRTRLELDQKLFERCTFSLGFDHDVAGASRDEPGDSKPLG